MSLSSIPGELRRAVAVRDRGRCAYCRLVQIGQAAVFHVDHIVPRSRGGATVLGNLALQCPHCSLRKSNKRSAIDPETGGEVTLFHPLEQTWGEHFELLADGTCRARTPTGRATVTALRMNEPLPLGARAMQLQRGLIPLRD